MEHFTTDPWLLLFKISTPINHFGDSLVGACIKLFKGCNLQISGNKWQKAGCKVILKNRLPGRKGYGYKSYKSMQAISL